MRALVVGGNGFIGGHLVDSLLSNGWDVAVFDRSAPRYRPSLREVECFLADLGNETMLTAALPGSDVVFHLASTTIPKSSNDAPVFDIQSNLVRTTRFLEICVKSNVARVVFLSSGGTVYGVPTSLPVSENHETNPICSYGIVKLAIEKYLYLFRRLYGLSYVVLRPSNPYGPRQDPMGEQGAVAVFMGCLARGLPIEIWGDGEIIRDFFHVSDLANACLAAATSKTASAIFNVGSGKGTTLNELLEVIASIVEKPLDVAFLPDRPFDVPELVLDTKRARDQLGWFPEISLKEGLADTWQWISSLPWSEAPG